MFLLRLLGRRVPGAMDWKQYAMALLAFNAALFVLAFGLLYAQPYLPLNPDGKGSLRRSDTRTPPESSIPAPIQPWSSTPSARS